MITLKDAILVLIDHNFLFGCIAVIVISNRQRTHKIDTKQLKKDAQAILDTLEYPDFDLSIVLVSNKQMHTLNKQFRDKDKPTDILSFPFYPQLKAGERIVATHADEKNIGDIIIAPQYVQDTLHEWGNTFQERMRILLVHGICHLLGYDHIVDEDYAIMKKEEDRKSVV